MNRDRIHRHVMIGLTVWFTLLSASVHLLHHHPLSISFHDANLASDNVRIAHCHGEAAPACPMPDMTAFSRTSSIQATEFCPVCLFLQNYQGRTANGSTFLTTSFLPEGLLQLRDDPPCSARTLSPAQPRAPPCSIA